MRRMYMWVAGGDRTLVKIWFWFEGYAVRNISFKRVVGSSLGGAIRSIVVVTIRN